jgi:hypothetical protein
VFFLHESGMDLGEGRTQRGGWFESSRNRAAHIDWASVMGGYCDRFLVYLLRRATLIASACLRCGFGFPAFEGFWDRNLTVSSCFWIWRGLLRKRERSACVKKLGEMLLKTVYM